MSKSVIIKLGSGDLERGFPKITVQLWTDGNPLPEQFVGALSAAPGLVDLYRNWQLVYRGLCARITGGYRQLVTSLPLDRDVDALEIDEVGITNISSVDFDDLCQQLQTSINLWLTSTDFLPIEQQLRSRLDRLDLIRVIVETPDPWLRHLPWQLWNFFQDYPQAEMALSQPEYQRRTAPHRLKSPQKVRILAVLGNSDRIDLSAEVSLLDRLPDAEVKFLVRPSRQEFNARLWEPQGWDILFFAGHSQTHSQTGRIYINDNPTHNSLTIPQLEQALTTAIDNGLKLAIFNSCDGLGLAQALEQLHIPTVIVMREPVPNCVAQEFFGQFLSAFAVDRLPLYLAVQRARRKLQGLEDDFPAASWLPVICQNLAVEPPTWLQLGGMPPCPYQGLAAFREENTRFFYGRERLTRSLLAAVEDRSLVAVVGASGSGKSSAVFAGLVPLLRQSVRNRGLTERDPLPPQIVSFCPGNNPFLALAAGLVQCGEIERFICAQPSYRDRDLVVELEQILRQDERGFLQAIVWSERQHLGIRSILIADQFEELYTLSAEIDRQPFLDLLLHAVKSAPAFTLILTLRADFWSHALTYHPFGDTLQGAMQVVAAMTTDELDAAIVSPAQQLQLQFEAGLAQKLIRDIGARSGSLPLLEFSLTQLWGSQSDGWLTHAAYTQMSSVETLLANHAEIVYAQLNELDRHRARKVLIQLVKPGVGSEDRRRLATKAEVKPENWDLVTRLASARLVITDRQESTAAETVEIIHAALLKSWKRLQNWLQSDREFRLWQEQLRGAKQQWEREPDESALLRGKQLVEADDWQRQRPAELSDREGAFIQQSLALRDRQFKSQQRRQHYTILGLAVGAIVASILAATAGWQWQQARISALKTANTSAETLLTSNREFDALLTSLRAGRQLQTTFGVDPATQTDTLETLWQAINFTYERNRLQGHGDRVNSVSFSPDGKTIASTSNDRTIKLWSLDGQLLRTLPGHQASVTSVSFSPDGRTIASASEDKTIKLWSQDGKLLKTLTGHTGGITSISFSPDGRTIASASEDKTIYLWHRDGRLLQTFRGHTGGVTSVSFSPDGRTIASASEDKTVKLWSQDGKLLQTLTGHPDVVTTVSFSPDGETMLSNCAKTIKLWHRDGKILRTIVRPDGRIDRAQFSPDGKTIASSSNDGTIEIWSLEGKVLLTLYGYSIHELSYLSFSPDGKTIASTRGDRTIELWSLDRQPVRVLKGHTQEVWNVSFSPNGRTIATASADNTVKLWNRSGQLLKTLIGHRKGVTNASFSPDGKLLVTTSYDKTVKLWTSDGQLLKTLTGHQGPVTNVSFSPDGQTFATASYDKTIKLWSRDGRELSTLTGHSDEIWGVSFSPDGQTIASASRDKTVKLWNRDGRQLRTLKGHQLGVTAVSFSPDGSTIASSSQDKTIRLWHLDGKLLRTLNGHLDEAWGVKFSPDGNFMASACHHKTVKLWSKDGKILRTLHGHHDGVWTVAFSPDGKTLASVSKDKFVMLWNWRGNLDLNLDRLLGQACARSGDYLKHNPHVSESDRHLCDR